MLDSNATTSLTDATNDDAKALASLKLWEAFRNGTTPVSLTIGTMPDEKITGYHRTPAGHLVPKVWDGNPKQHCLDLQSLEVRDAALQPDGTGKSAGFIMRGKVALPDGQVLQVFLQASSVGTKRGVVVEAAGESSSTASAAVIDGDDSADE